MAKVKTHVFQGYLRFPIRILWAPLSSLNGGLHEYKCPLKVAIEIPEEPEKSIQRSAFSIGLSRRFCLPY